VAPAHGARTVVYDFLVKRVSVPLTLHDTQNCALYGVNKTVFCTELSSLFSAAIELNRAWCAIVAPDVQCHALPPVELPRIFTALRVVLIRGVAYPLPFVFVGGTVVDNHAVGGAGTLIILQLRSFSTPWHKACVALRDEARFYEFGEFDEVPHFAAAFASRFAFHAL
jgi:hypothetical protein